MPQLTPIQQFAERLAQERREKAARERRDVQKQDVAAAVGVSSSTYGRYEAALTMPDDPTIFRLAAYFGVTPSWLRYGQAPREADTRGKGSAPITDPNLRPATQADADALEERIHGKRAAKKVSGSSPDIHPNRGPTRRGKG